MPSPSPFKRLVVYDFDWSLIETDSDHWVFEHLSPELYKDQLDAAGKVQWTDLQEMLLTKLFEQGVTRQQLEKTLGTAPFHSDMLEAIRFMKSEGAELVILSDANTVYIDVILKAYGVDQLFSKVITNPAQYDTRGCLHVKRFHGPELSPHGCSFPCQVNLCKGQELEKLMAAKQYDQVLYVGDSTNDYCPSTRLSRTDVVFARSDLLLQKAIEANPSTVLANVVYWQNPTVVLESVRSIFGSAPTTFSSSSNPATSSSMVSLPSLLSSSASSSVLSSPTASPPTTCVSNEVAGYVPKLPVSAIEMPVIV